MNDQFENLTERLTAALSEMQKTEDKELIASMDSYEDILGKNEEAIDLLEKLIEPVTEEEESEAIFTLFDNEGLCSNSSHSECITESGKTAQEMVPALIESGLVRLVKIDNERVYLFITEVGHERRQNAAALKMAQKRDEIFREAEILEEKIKAMLRSAKIKSLNKLAVVPVELPEVNLESVDDSPIVHVEQEKAREDDSAENRVFAYESQNMTIEAAEFLGTEGSSKDADSSKTVSEEAPENINVDNEDPSVSIPVVPDANVNFLKPPGDYYYSGIEVEEAPKVALPELKDDKPDAAAENVDTTRQAVLRAQALEELDRIRNTEDAEDNDDVEVMLPIDYGDEAEPDKAKGEDRKEFDWKA